MFYVFYNLAIEGRTRSKALGKDVYRVFMACGVWTLFLWLLYPVAWGCCEGGNVISPDSEAVFYGVLDFCAKPIFSIMLIVGHWNINPARMGLNIKDPDLNLDSAANREKYNMERLGMGNGTANGIGNGIATGVDDATRDGGMRARTEFEQTGHGAAVPETTGATQVHNTATANV